MTASEVFVVQYRVPSHSMTVVRNSKTLPLIREMAHLHYDDVVETIYGWFQHRGLDTKHLDGLIDRMAEDAAASVREKEVWPGDTINLHDISINIGFDDKSEAALFKLFHC